MKEWVISQERQVVSTGGKVKITDFSQEPPEENAALLIPLFLDTVTFISNF